MYINAGKERLIIQPEHHAESFQLEWIAKQLKENNIDHKAGYQWEITGISLPLTQKSNDNQAN